MSKKFTIGIFIAISIALLMFVIVRISVLEAPYPWKVIDASDPKFDPDKFRLTDYGGNTQLQRNLDLLFPVGTEKLYVDRISVDIGGATVKIHVPKHPMYHDNTYYDYGYHNKARWTARHAIPFIPPLPSDWSSHLFRVEYDKDLKVKKVTVLSALSFPKYFYTRDPKWLRELNDVFEK